MCITYVTSFLIRRTGVLGNAFSVSVVQHVLMAMHIKMNIRFKYCTKIDLLSNEYAGIALKFVDFLKSFIVNDV